MCNLYRIEANEERLAVHFGAAPSDPAPTELTPYRLAPTGRPLEIKPGGHGIVVRKAGDRRVLRWLRWGFSRPQTDRTGQPLHFKPVNLVADLTNPMWDRMVPDPRYRCLVPLTAFAQPAGPRGRMTRTWFGVDGGPVFAWAGFCRNSETGPVYAAMTTDSNAAVAPLNPRMPVILAPEEYERWLDGSIDDVIDFQFRPPFPAERMTVEATDELWVQRTAHRGQTAPT